MTRPASDRPASGAPERVHVVTVTQAGFGGQIHTCEVCGATGSVPPRLPCLGPAPAAPVVSSEGEAAEVADGVTVTDVRRYLNSHGGRVDEFDVPAIAELRDWINDALATARAEGAREVRDGIQDIIDARCAGDFSPLLPKLRAVLIAEESR